MAEKRTFLFGKSRGSRLLTARISGPGARKPGNGETAAVPGRLPFAPDSRAQVEGTDIMKYNNKKLQALLQEVWERLEKQIPGRQLGGGPPGAIRTGSGPKSDLRLDSPPRPKSS